LSKAARGPSVKVEHEFAVKSPVQRTWEALHDHANVVALIPGVSAAEGEGGFAGALKLRVKSTTVTYRGTAQVTSADDEAHAATIQIDGSRPRGDGSLKAEVAVGVVSYRSGSKIKLVADVSAIGAGAEADPEAYSAAVRRVLERFAENLTGTLGAAPAKKAAAAKKAQPTPKVAPAAQDPVVSEPAPVAEEVLTDEVVLMAEPAADVEPTATAEPTEIPTDLAEQLRGVDLPYPESPLRKLAPIAVGAAVVGLILRAIMRRRR